MSVPMQECTFHMTFAIIYYEITEKMHLCFLTTSSTDITYWFPVSMNVWEKLRQYSTVVDLSLQGCLIRVECFRHLSAFKLSTLY